jgi:hypothetical protein
MVTHALAVGAAAARARLPELIGEAFRTSGSPDDSAADGTEVVTTVPVPGATT